MGLARFRQLNQFAPGVAFAYQIRMGLGGGTALTASARPSAITGMTGIIPGHRMRGVRETRGTVTVQIRHAQSKSVRRCLR